jgi:hypothetical protein
MPMTVQAHYDHTKFVLDPQRDGKAEWDQAACTWLNNYVYANPRCPWDDDAKGVMGAELLGAGLPLQNWVEQWKSSPNLRQVWFKFYQGEEWNLEIGASAGANASATEYRVLDLRQQLLGVSADGNLTHMVQSAARPQNTGTPASPVPPGPGQQVAPIVPATPQQVAKAIDDANSPALHAAGANVAAALNRLQTQTALAGGVARTRAALENLVRVAGTAN